MTLLDQESKAKCFLSDSHFNSVMLSMYSHISSAIIVFFPQTEHNLEVPRLWGSVWLGRMQVEFPDAVTDSPATDSNWSGHGFEEPLG